MKIHELQNIVIVEAICLTLIVLIIVAAFKRWKTTLITCCVFATIAFFSAWSNIMAFASVLVYGSAASLLWRQLERNNANLNPTKNYTQGLSWTILAIGVTMLIVNNTRNIFIYLG